MKKEFYIGCVADDFTGASDIASFFVRAGLQTVLFNGIPQMHDLGDTNADAVVIALKSRTQERNSAVADSLQAFRWLKDAGAEKLYFKYCSTFDSTSEGNIGPVADAVMEAFDIPYTIICPALPVNGRKVIDGKLYVNGVLLEDSPMRNHPLTPMTESELKKLIEMQSRYKGLSIGRKAKIEWKADQEALCASEKHCYLIPDYYEEEHGIDIAEQFSDIILYTGGSGLAEYIGMRKDKIEEEIPKTNVEERIEGKEILLAGSCSEATRNQVRCYQDAGYVTYKVEADKVLLGEENIENIWNFIEKHPEGKVLVYSSEEPDKVKAIQEAGKEKISNMLEQLMAELAQRAIGVGYKKVIVAGGETSGAVIKSLNYQGYQIGKSIAPGVPVMIPLENMSMRLVLKSGNFGQVDFFERACKELEV